MTTAAILLVRFFSFNGHYEYAEKIRKSRTKVRHEQGINRRAR